VSLLDAAGREVGEARTINALNSWMHQPRIMTVAATCIGPHVFELGLKVWLAATSELPSVSSPGRAKIPLAEGEAASIMRELLSSRLVRQQIARYVEKAHGLPKMSVMRQLMELAEEAGLDTGAKAPEGAIAG